MSQKPIRTFLVIAAFATSLAGLAACAPAIEDPGTVQNPMHRVCNEQYANNTVCVYRDAFGDGSIFRFAGGDSNYTDHDGFGADRYSDGDEVNDTGSSFTNWTDRYVVFYKDANSQGEPLVCLAPRQSLSETYNPSSPMGTGDAASSHQLYTYDQFHLLPTVCLQYVKPDGRMIYAYQP